MNINQLKFVRLLWYVKSPDGMHFKCHCKGLVWLWHKAEILRRSYRKSWATIFCKV